MKTSTKLYIGAIFVIPLLGWVIWRFSGQKQSVEIVLVTCISVGLFVWGMVLGWDTY